MMTPREIAAENTILLSVVGSSAHGLALAPFFLAMTWVTGKSFE